MINCKYDLLTSQYDNGKYIVYKPDSLSNTTAFQVRSTNFDAKPDVKSNSRNRVMHTKLSLVKYSDDKTLESFSINSPYDTLNIHQSIDSSFKLMRDVSYDSTISAEENIKKVLKMYSDELKQYLFNFANSVGDAFFTLNTYYVNHCIGGCCNDAHNPIDESGQWTHFQPRYTASNVYILKKPGSNYGASFVYIPSYGSISDLHLKTPDTTGLSGMNLNSEQTQPFNLVAGMISPKMQYPDDSRGYDINFNMPHPVMFTAIGNNKIMMHYCDYTSTSYPSKQINNSSVELNPVTWEHTLLYTPGCMFWNKGGIHISYVTSTTPAKLSIAYCKYSEESSALTNVVTVAYGNSEVAVKINAVLSDLQLDSNHFASLIPMYHYESENNNYFVVALFHNERTYSATYPTSFKGLFILCMETGDIYNASTGFNNKKFNLSSSFDVTDLLWIYGMQQYDDAAELGSNIFQYTTSTDGEYSVYTFTNKRIEICPYKAYGNYYLVCNPELYSTWYVYDLDSHKVHNITNVPVTYNHCVSTEGMYGFRFVTNNKTQYVINNNYTYPSNPTYNENVIDCIGIVRPIPLNLTFKNMQSDRDVYFVRSSYTYKPKEEYETLDLNKSIAAFTINSSLPISVMDLYFVVDITTDDKFIEFHHKRIKPEHLQRACLQPIDIPYTFVDNTASTSLTPYNNIKVYLNEFLNSDTFVSNSNDLIDVTLKRTSITSTNQSFRIILYDEDNNIITQDELRKKYGVATIDIDFLMNT